MLTSVRFTSSYGVLKRTRDGDVVDGVVDEDSGRKEVCLRHASSGPKFSRINKGASEFER
jgi:hypothetical protein